jgi:membrane glycosyltransferase
VASAIGFTVATAVVLFLPKILAVAVVAMPRARRFGGALGVTLSLLLELLFSALLAPIRMLFHTQFVLAALTGWSIHWNSPSREDAETTWSEAARRHGVHTLLGLVWAAGVYGLAPAYLWWLAPVVGALALSIPVSVYSSRAPLGRALRRARLFLIPEETDPPPELRALRAYRDRAGAPPRFVDAVVDPLVNAIACATSVPQARRAPHALARREQLVASCSRIPWRSHRCMPRSGSRRTPTRRGVPHAATTLPGTRPSCAPPPDRLGGGRGHEPR